MAMARELSLKQLAAAERQREKHIVSLGRHSSLGRQQLSDRERLIGAIQEEAHLTSREAAKDLLDSGEANATVAAVAATIWPNS